MELRPKLPYLLTGKVENFENMVETTRNWRPHEVVHNIEEIENRYEAMRKKEISNYAGLTLFIEFVKMFKEIPNPSPAHKDLLLKCQKKVLFYHNTQYEGTENDGGHHEGDNPELPDASPDNQ